MIRAKNNKLVIENGSQLSLTNKPVESPVSTNKIALSTQVKERTMEKETLNNTVVKLKSDSYNTALELNRVQAIENAVRTLKLAGITDSKIIENAKKVAENQARTEFAKNYSIAGGKHSDFLTGEARRVFTQIDNLINDFNALTSKEGKIGKGNCNLELRPNFKVISQDDSKTEETTTENETKSAGE
tara:strand:- start:2506 stop:3066 length:561 start_codon:yes stop_codon:yes gene_type:complete